VYRKFYRTLLPALMLTLLFLTPQTAMRGTRDGLLLWANAVLPALLPFYVVTQLLQQCGGFALLNPILRPVCRLLSLPDDFGGLLLAGWLSGAPNGARLLAQTTDDNALCTRTCAAFTVTSPLFLIGTAGQMLGSPRLGALVYGIHLLAALCTGFLWRGHGSNSSAPPSVPSKPEPFLTALPDALRSSCLSLLFIGCAIAFFSALTAVLQQLGLTRALQSVLHNVLPADAVTALIAGFFEVSQGTLSAAQARLSLPLRLSLLCGFASFGGVSVLCQAKVFLQQRVSASFYFLQRLTHAALSFCLCRGLCLLFGGAMQTFAAIRFAPQSSAQTFPWLLPALCLIFAILPRKKAGDRSGGHWPPLQGCPKTSDPHDSHKNTGCTAFGRPLAAPTKQTKDR